MDSATCIVALVHNKNVWMGGDSLSSDAKTKDQALLRNHKVFKRENVNGTWLIGFSGAYRFGQLLEYEFQIPPIGACSDNMMQYMVTVFVPALQACLQSGGFEQRENGRAIGGSLLVGIEDKIFNIGSQYSVLQHELQYDAIGCGAQVALGSLFSTSDSNPNERIMTALKAAEKFSSGVKGPFTVIHCD